LVFVDLSPVRDASLVPFAIGGALGVGEAGGRSPREAVAEYLRDAETLLVLDNLEQVIECGAVIADLLSRCAAVKILATSREPLHVDVEHQFPVRPLAVPDINMRMRPTDLERIPAAALFLDRARMVRPEFALSEENARTVAEICVRLDGLPLAIEMAAAQVKYLTPETMARELDRSTGSLVSSARNLPDRHRTLHACIAWSYDLLNPIQQTYLRTLAVFRGGFTAEAAEAVAEGTATAASRSVLTALVDKGLVEMSPQPDGTPRLAILETIREFALESLAARGEVDGARRRHAQYALDLARRAEPRLHGPEQDLWAQRLESERDNVRAAMEWALNGGDLGLAADLGWTLHWFWYFYGHNREGYEWLSRVLPATSLSGRARARALAAGSVMAWSIGEPRQAERWSSEAVPLLRQTHDDAGLALALHYFGHILQEDQGRPQDALAAFEESIALFRKLGNEWGVAFSSNCSGLALGGVHEYTRAVARMDEAHAAYQRLGDRRLLAWGLADLAVMLAEKGDLDRAARISERAVAELRKAKVSVRLLWALGQLADLTARRDAVRALPLNKECLILAEELGTRRDAVMALWGIGAAAWSIGQSEAAAAVLGAADTQYRIVNPPGPPTERRQSMQRMADEIHRALGDTFDAAWQRGATADLNDTIEEALAVEPARRGEAGQRVDRGLLSPREREVATLIAQGLSNREIGKTLLIGHRTVGTHVQSILNKLGVDRRSQIAAWAAAHGLDIPTS
jgi:non-specific serine/threonine protein kinase